MSGSLVSEIRTVQKFYRILKSRTIETWILDDFLQKLKKPVHNVL